MKALAIAAANLRRMLRNRETPFFVFVLPLALVLLIGLQFGGSAIPVIAVTNLGGERADSLVAALSAEPRLEILPMDDEAEMRLTVERGGAEGGLIIPPGYDDALTGGGTVELPYLVRPTGVGAQLQAVIGAVLAEETAPVIAARVATDLGAGPYEAAEQRAQGLVPGMARVEVIATSVGEALFPGTLGRFDLGASSQLTLFMFVTGLSGAAVLIETRRLGLSRRMLSTPTGVSTVMTGEGLGRFAVVLVQGLYIMLATLVLFRVNWGDPVGAAAVVILFAAVGAGAAMLAGTVFANAQQAGGVGVVLALGAAALGGSMIPVELFPPGLQAVARFTPHYWANSAFAELVRHGAAIDDILPQLGILAAYAGALLVLAAWRLRRVITRP